MNAPQRLTVYGLGLVALFVAAFTVAGLVVPKSAVAAWAATAEAGDPASTMEMGSAKDSVDGYTATLTGDLAASGESVLTVTLTQDGEPVTTLEPYLGGYEHLYLDFKVDGTVRTAHFVLDTTGRE